MKHLKQTGENIQKNLKQMRNGGKDMRKNFGRNMKKRLMSKQQKSHVKIEDLQKNVKRWIWELRWTRVYVSDVAVVK